MQETTTSETHEREWARLRPALDEVLNAMDDRDRDAIVLRFFDGRSFAQIGARLQVTENGARMRVERALDKLRTRLVRRGVTSTHVALAAALGQQAGAAVPAGLAGTVTGAALAAGATGGGIWATLTAFLSVNKIPLGIAGVAVLAGLLFFWEQERDNVRLRLEAAVARDAIDAIDALRKENLSLARSATEVARLREEARDLARLQAEVAEHRGAAGSTARPTPVGRTPAPATGKGDELVQLHLPNADIDTVLSAYQIWAGKRIARDASLLRGRPVFNLSIKKPVPKSEALAALHALLQVNGVDILPAADGGLVAIRRNAP